MAVPAARVLMNANARSSGFNLKSVRRKLYIHISCLPLADELVRGKVEKAKRELPLGWKWNIARIEPTRVSFLLYPDFESNPHPRLVSAFLVDFATGHKRTYKASKTNPPILHRKDSFLTVGHRWYNRFRRLTLQEEKAGLLD